MAIQAKTTELKQVTTMAAQYSWYPILETLELQINLSSKQVIARCDTNKQVRTEQSTTLSFRAMSNRLEASLEPCQLISEPVDTFTLEPDEQLM